jgi:putative nucleotidyltransferase with HDIG domain
VAELAAAFIAPNSFYSESLTDSAKQNAYDSVPPVSVSYVTSETLVRRGERVTAEDIEALQKYGLAESEIRWQDYTSAGLLVVLSAFLIIIFLRRNDELRVDVPSLGIIAIFFVVFLIGARLVLPIHALTPYLYPLAAYALVIGRLFGAEPALVTVIPLIILSIYGHGNAFELFLYYGIGSIFGVLIPRQEQRISGYIWVGLSVTASSAAVITIYRLLDSETTGLGLLTLLAVALINGVVAAGFTVLIQSVVAPLLGQTTPLQLLELSRPDHPLLEHLLRNAPGTYQHSLQVANLAEQAAERIGADSLLTRVGALYHDIGKTQNAQFFVENQLPGQLDTHENIPAKKSAGIIIQHVVTGLELARKHKLPRRVQDFIAEHHGTFKTRYQWTQALKEALGDSSLLDEKDFQYVGPRPQSRETALVMLADGCEARVRAKRPPNEAELKAIIKDTVDTCLAAGQLGDTPLTLQDLTAIMDSFAATLKGVYHPRVEYPSMDVPTQPTSSSEDESLLESLSAETQPTLQPFESFNQPTIKAPKDGDETPTPKSS